MVRGSARSFQDHWPGAEVVEAEALDRESLERALAGVEVAYYLIHSLLLGPKRFAAADVEAAVNFRRAAEAQGVKRIIYLGGLGDLRASRSPHLQSRMRVARELSGGPPVTILRAAIIIGSGSASYEIIRHLVGRLPLILIPPWAKNRCQPIAVRDVIKYLVGALETPETAGRSFDIGGPDVMSYEVMLRTFADIIRSRVIFLNAPVSSIGVFSYLASLITPVPAPITRALMEGLRDEVVVRDDAALDLVSFSRLDFREAVLRALTREEQDKVYTRWSNAYPPLHHLALRLHELADGPTYTATHSLVSDKSAAALFKSVSRVGGKSGWFHNNWMWRMRGAVDRVLAGVGTARGRRSQSSLTVDDVVDFWRVEDIQPDRRLLLRAEMILPGRAWLEFTIKEENGQRRLAVTASFQTRSRFGRLYWYAFLPFHHSIFQGLIEQIEKRA
jgi:uncharacterized protein YbjT (DUF2867 family)